MMRPTDEELLERCRRQDPAALRELWLTYKDRVHSIALYFFHGDTGLADDVTQDVFIKVLASLDRFAGRADLSTWLYRIVANACMDEQRRRRRFSFLGELSDALPTAWSEPRPSAIEGLVLDERARMIRDAIGALSPRLRITVLMRYFDDLSYEQMAAALDCSMGTIASRLSRAHAELARRLGHLRPGAEGVA